MCKHKPCRYQRQLDHYVSKLREEGDLVPDSGQAPGEPNLSEIARQTSIPYKHLCTTQELRERITEAAAELGVGQRPPGLWTRDLQRQVTYGELIEASRDSSPPSAGPGGRYRNILNRFMRHHQKFADDVIGKELINLDQPKILKLLARWKSGSLGTDSSALRHWQKRWASLASLEHLPNDFNAALKLLVEAADVSIAGLARATGIDRKLLWEYLNTGKRPLKSPQHVRALEAYFRLPNETLVDMLPRKGGTSVPGFVKADWLQELDPAERDLVQQALPQNFHLLPANQQRRVFQGTTDRIRRQPERQPYHELQRARLKAPYCLNPRDWPPRVRNEFERLVKSVGAAIKEHKPTPGVFARLSKRQPEKLDVFLGHKATRGKPKRWSPRTKEAYQGMFSSFLGFLLLEPGEGALLDFERPDGQQEFTAKRYGLSPDELSIGLIGVEELMAEWLTFRCFERGVGYTSETLGSMMKFRSLIQKSHGWIRYQRDIAEHVERVCAERELHDPGMAQSVTFAALCDDTVAFLDAANQRIHEETPDVATDLVARNVFEPILPILNSASPAAVFEEGLEHSRRDLTRTRHIDSAIAWRDFVYVRLVWHTALRGHHFPLFLVGDHPGRAHICEVQIDGQSRIMLCVPRGDFKNSDALPSFDVWRTFLPDDLAEEYRVYVNYFRPLLDPSGKDPHLFLSKTGGPLKDGSLRARFTHFTKHYLSPFSSAGLRLDGVQPFGPHAVRHIAAVDIYLKTGSYQAVADHLFNSEQVVKRRYAVLSLEQRRQRVAAQLKAAQKRA